MAPTRAQELAVLRSVVYAALFDYPLTLAQLHATLVEVRAERATVAGWWSESDLLQATVECHDGCYFPAGRRDLLQVRARREALSRDLLQREQRILSMVSHMPFVRMVAVSGSLAHLNAERSADLDLFVITAAGRVWGVTLTVLALARLFGCRKRMCLNYVVSERALAVEPADLFSANQIVHLQPIAGHGMFARFVNANPFVRSFYPNFTLARGKKAPPQAARALIERALSWSGLGAAGEWIARATYRWHLRRRAAAWQSADQVRLEPECLKLHTRSHRASILARFDAAMAEALVNANTKDTSFVSSCQPVRSTAARRSSASAPRPCPRRGRSSASKYDGPRY